jgi:alpha-tubulin suppressor-like RCC1 family protein
VVAWGRSDNSETAVPPELTDVVAISGNGTHCLALTASGRVIAWGSNDCGECDVPAMPSGATAIAAGYGHSLAVTG